MKEKEAEEKDKKKGGFGRMVKKLAKRIEEKLQKFSCCGSDKDEGSSCF